jgi:hypothetical protein
MATTSERITGEQRAELRRHFEFFRNEGTIHTGLWMFAPHGYDGSFEAYSEGYRTLAEAEAAAWHAWTDLLTPEERAEFEAEAEKAGR